MKEFSKPDATFLLLDSDPLMRSALSDALENGGYLVITAGDLGAAVDELNETQPDLLIVRPYINNMPGQMAADYLRSRMPGLPVLMVAGFLDDDRINIRNSVEEFYSFPKPFTSAELLAKIKDVLYTIRSHH